MGKQHHRRTHTIRLKGKTPCFLRKSWHFALHGDKLKRGELQSKEVLGERIVLGRDSSGNPFALRDNCPHRGMPLSEGKFDGRAIQCCYHGWQFDCSGTCQKIPALADTSFNVRKILGRLIHVRGDVSSPLRCHRTLTNDR